MANLGSYDFFHSSNPRAKKDTICKFGIGEQDMSTCRMIYIHVNGYYPGEEKYQDALRRLCPNLQWGDQANE